MPLAPAEKQSTVKNVGQIELAQGQARLAGGFNAKDNRNRSKAGKAGADKTPAGKKDAWE
ncbi:hypothetical protein [Pararhizobium sp. PWRC1-1]|uniref:hypothetical protein n=1 Tax=Pararhizobium sp. PWRC1-1 TaxID=2804566 RepID=UPI003CEE774A